MPSAVRFVSLRGDGVLERFRRETRPPFAGRHADRFSAGATRLRANARRRIAAAPRPPKRANSARLDRARPTATRRKVVKTNYPDSRAAGLAQVLSVVVPL